MGLGVPRKAYERTAAMKKNYVLEVVLIEIIFFMLLWLWDEYIAFLLTLFFTAIAAGVLLISLIAELLERTKVPRNYFYWLAVSVCVPLAVAAIFKYIL